MPEKPRLILRQLLYLRKKTPMANSNKDLAEQIKRLALIVERMTPAIAPIPAIPAIPAIPPIIPTNSGDHDLLTKLDTKVDQIQLDVTELKSKMPIYVTQSEHQEVVRVQRLHDDDIEALKSFRDTLTGKIWGIGIIAGFGSGVLMLVVEHFLNIVK
jgi:hypothetical protein